MAAIVALSVCVGASEEPATKPISVGRMIFCRAVKDREPEGAADAFPTDIGQVYCFTVVLDAGPDETHVVHKWYLGDKLMAEVKLKAQGEYWRTWSVKHMQPEWTGRWRVDVVSADGKVLKSALFVLGEAEPAEATEEGAGDVETPSGGDQGDQGGSDEGSLDEGRSGPSDGTAEVESGSLEGSER